MRNLIKGLLSKLVKRSTSVGVPARRPQSFRPQLEVLEDRKLMSAGTNTAFDLGPIYAGSHCVAFSVNQQTHRLQYENSGRGFKDVKAFAGHAAWKVTAVCDQQSDSVAVFVNERANNGQLWQITFKPDPVGNDWLISAPQKMNLGVSSFDVRMSSGHGGTYGTDYALVLAVNKADGHAMFSQVVVSQNGDWQRATRWQDVTPKNVYSVRDVAATTTAHYDIDGNLESSRVRLFILDNRGCVWNHTNPGWSRLGGTEHGFKFIMAMPDRRGDGVNILGSPDRHHWHVRIQRFQVGWTGAWQPSQSPYIPQ